MITTNRLRRVADDDIAAACALARANLRGGRYAWAGVPPSLLLATFIECFDIWPAWPHGNFDNTASRRVILHSAFTSEDTWPKSATQLLPCGEPVRTRRRLAVVLCNLWRRLPAPHPVDEQGYVYGQRDRDNAIVLRYLSVPLPGHPLLGYTEELAIAMGDDWLDWFAPEVRATTWRVNSLAGKVEVVDAFRFRVYKHRQRFGHLLADAGFDASCLPAVPMSVAGGE